ncbi:diguanylate cyclase [Ligilactobacillus salitolerans]|uniref:Diguanylate cyclase n=1 Tax=Ligilactobacillus salitolerans TaxID=1808352 RepID=A0A401IUW8_9LACO|nr:GGDEF domain-containing protein [Ligilactobacillus salitolerans]GBG95324.1 diguanylate cyclase [Ligilactobacillus salitolerans]
MKSDFLVELIVSWFFVIGIAAIYHLTADVLEHGLKKRALKTNLVSAREVYKLLYFASIFIILLFVQKALHLQLLGNVQLVCLSIFLSIDADVQAYLVVGGVNTGVFLSRCMFMPRTYLPFSLILWFSLMLLLSLSFWAAHHGRWLQWLAALSGGVSFWGMAWFFLKLSLTDLLIQLGTYILLVSATLPFVFLFAKAKQKSLRIKNENCIDALTGAKNYRCFTRDFNRAVKESQAKRQTLAFVMLDIDYFKDINDRYGHPVGNLTLRKMTTEVKLCISQLCPTAEIYRLGGEEFGILLYGQNSAATQAFATECRTRITRLAIPTEQGRIYITGSIGYDFLTVQDNADEFYSRVDQYLYQAKANGRSRVVGPLERLGADLVSN